MLVDCFPFKEASLHQGLFLLVKSLMRGSNRGLSSKGQGMSRLDSFCNLIALRIYSYGAGHGYYYYYLSKTNHSPQNIPEPSIFHSIFLDRFDSVPFAGDAP